MKIRIANPTDGQKIYDLLVPYQKESYFNKKHVNPDHARAHIKSWLENTTVILAEDNNKTVGMVVIAFGYTFWEELEADIDFMFVAESHRRTPISRMLRDEAILQMDNQGALLQYGMSGSGVEEKLFVNLWKKRGFEHLGTLLVRDLTKNQTEH